MKNTYSVTLPHDADDNGFYSEVSHLSPDPKDIPIFSGYTYKLNTPVGPRFRINVTEEDLNFLKLKYNFNSVQQAIPA